MKRKQNAAGVNRDNQNKKGDAQNESIAIDDLLSEQKDVDNGCRIVDCKGFRPEMIDPEHVVYDQIEFPHLEGNGGQVGQRLFGQTGQCFPSVTKTCFGYYSHESVVQRKAGGQEKSR